MKKFSLLLFLPLLVVSVLYGCGQQSETVEPNSTNDITFVNLEENASFVGSTVCFDCHESQYTGYQDHGMANSMFRLTPEKSYESFGSEIVVDSISGFHYQTVRADSGFFMEEYLLNSSGKKVHQLFREMEWVVGSGTSARTYLTEENGWFYELPITWYTQQKRWDFSPGYRVANKRFDRKIVDRCMTCHNSYPTPVPQTAGKYLEIPEGIGCERCHGPGSLHVETQLAAPSVPGAIDSTIINPTHLSLERGLDVCQQCHQNATISLLRTGRTAYDFRPSESLDEYISLYAAHESNSEGIGVISHAERMKLSACFLETQDLETPLQCTTCHDPHNGFRTKGPDYFNTTCIDCHSNQASDPSTFGLPEDATHSAPASNCISCHMPKSDIIEAPHSAFTDHWIRVVDSELKPETVHSGAVLTPVFEQDRKSNATAELYGGMAEISEGKRTANMEMLRNGREKLGRALKEKQDNSEAFYLHGYASVLLGEFPASIESLEQSVRMDATQAERLNTLAQAYEQVGRPPDVIEKLYKEALRIQPALSDVRVNLGRFLESKDRVAEAIVEYKKAIQEEAWNDIAHFNLGTAYLRMGDAANAEKSLKEAIHLNPFHGSSQSNLGLLYIQQQKLQQAEAVLKQAIERLPKHTESLDNLGTLYLNQDRYEEAVSMLMRASQSAPNNDGLLSKLALAQFRNDDLQAAKNSAEKALRLNAQNELARQIVDALN